MFLNTIRVFLVLQLCFVACGPSDGPYVDHYPSGAVKEEGYYKNGEKTGQWRFFWKDGQKKVEGGYHKDEPHGEWTFYDENGRVIAKGTYRNGQMWEGRFVRYVLGTKKVIVVNEGQQVN